MEASKSRAVTSLGLRIAVVFVVATAVISQCLEWLRMGLDINSEVVALAQYGPALAALVTWLVFRQTIGQMMPTRVSNAQVRGRLVLAVAACGLFAIVLWLGYSLIGGRDTYGIQTIAGIPLWLIAVIWLAGATAEEMGWRGVLQPALETGLPRWGAGIVTGLLWSVWHLPMIMLGGVIALAFIATTTVLSVMMAYAGDGSPAQRVITTSLVHWLINLSILIIAGVSPDITGLTSELAAISMATLVVLTLLALIARHRARAPRFTTSDETFLSKADVVRQPRRIRFNDEECDEMTRWHVSGVTWHRMRRSMTAEVNSSTLERLNRRQPGYRASDEGTTMYFGGSIALIALGAILAFAVQDQFSGVNLVTVGYICMAAGALGIVLSLVVTQRSRGRGRDDLPPAR